MSSTDYKALALEAHNTCFEDPKKEGRCMPIEKLFTPDAKMFAPFFWNETDKKVKDFNDIYTQMVQASCPDMHCKVDEAIGEGKNVCVRGVWHGTFTGGPWMAEITPNGSACKQPGVFWYKFNDEGKIHEVHAHWDDKNFWRDWGCFGWGTRALHNADNMMKTLMAGKAKDMSEAFATAPHCHSRIAVYKYKEDKFSEMIDPKGELMTELNNFRKDAPGLLDLQLLHNKEEKLLGGYYTFESEEARESFITKLLPKVKKMMEEKDYIDGKENILIKKFEIMKA